MAGERNTVQITEQQVVVTIANASTPTSLRIPAAGYLDIYDSTGTTVIFRLHADGRMGVLNGSQQYSL